MQIALGCILVFLFWVSDGIALCFSEKLVHFEQYLGCRITCEDRDPVSVLLRPTDCDHYCTTFVIPSYLSDLDRNLLTPCLANLSGAPAAVSLPRIQQFSILLSEGSFDSIEGHEQLLWENADHEVYRLWHETELESAQRQLEAMRVQ